MKAIWILILAIAVGEAEGMQGARIWAEMVRDRLYTSSMPPARRNPRRGIEAAVEMFRAEHQNEDEGPPLSSTEDAPEAPSGPGRRTEHEHTIVREMLRREGMNESQVREWLRTIYGHRTRKEDICGLAERLSLRTRPISLARRYPITAAILIHQAYMQADDGGKALMVQMASTHPHPRLRTRLGIPSTPPQPAYQEAPGTADAYEDPPVQEGDPEQSEDPFELYGWIPDDDLMIDPGTPEQQRFLRALVYGDE
ncbi:MAG: hypothetical protein LBJ69_01775 [Holosporales bacterium]|nr:hypothetical protein [Holosporales bacterium]